MKNEPLFYHLCRHRYDCRMFFFFFFSIFSWVLPMEESDAFGEDGVKLFKQFDGYLKEYHREGIHVCYWKSCPLPSTLSPHCKFTFTLFQNYISIVSMPQPWKRITYFWHYFAFSIIITFFALDLLLISFPLMT